jgi:HEAT repeat protein
MTDYLTASLLDPDANDKVRKLLTNILNFLGDNVLRRLMQLLAEEDLATNRRLLAEVLTGIGAAAVPILQEHLFDERWYVVRNAVSILGELRSQDSLPHLTPLLEHREVRVRRETIRTLSRIGGPRAVGILLQAAEADDQETRRQALLSLGAIRAASAIPTLLKLLEQPDWSQRTIDIKKDAIRALGEIRASEAVAPLAALLGKRRLWRRTRHDELRVIAAAALGEIADAASRAALDKACHDRSAAVARAAAQALMLLEKDHS